MNGKLVVFLIALVCIIMFIMQILAIFYDEAYIKWDKENWRQWTWCNCGVFDCECTGLTLRKSSCGALADHIKAACAFGILAIIWIGVSMIVHLMLCFAKTSGMILSKNMGVKFVNYMWVWHLISALFNLICWACLAGAFDRELCTSLKLKNHYDLAWGFFVLVIITVVDAILAFVCWKHMHVYYSYSGGGGGGHRSSRGPPPGYYESNPIDRQGFHGRRY